MRHTKKGRLVYALVCLVVMLCLLAPSVLAEGGMGHMVDDDTDDIDPGTFVLLLHKVVAGGDGHLIEGIDLSGFHFEYQLRRQDESWPDEWEPLRNSEDIAGNVLNYTDALGDLAFQREMDATGEYLMRLKEVDTREEGKPTTGWRFNGSTFYVRIVVTEKLDDAGQPYKNVKAWAVPEDNFTYPAPPDATNQVEMIVSNLYLPLPVQLTIDFATKHLTGRPLTAGEFEARIYQIPADATTENQLVMIGTNVAPDTADPSCAKFAFVAVDALGDPAYGVDENPITTLTIDRAGTYHYVLKETLPQGAENGVYEDVTYDPMYDDAGAYVGVKEHPFSVEATDVNGALQVTILKDIHGNDMTITVENSYRATKAKATLTGQKTVVGWPEGKQLANKFSFDLYDSEGKVIASTTTEDKNGTIRFADLPELTYTKAGTYTYTIRENVGTLAGITYDPTVWTATVTVTDEEVGGLVAAAPVYTIDATGETSDRFTFTNTYKAESPAEMTLTASATLEGRTEPMQAGEFTFELFEAKDGTFALIDELADATASNDAEGKAVFTKALAEAKTYYFVIKGKLPQSDPLVKDPITYDASVYHVTVVTEDNGDGQICIAGTKIEQVKQSDTGTTVTTEVQEIRFENLYNGYESDSPETGDDSHMGLWAMLMLACGAAAIALGGKKKFHT